MSPYRVGKLCEVPAGQTPEQYRSAIISGKVKPKFKPYTHIAFHCGSKGLTLPITASASTEDIPISLLAWANSFYLKILFANIK